VLRRLTKAACGWELLRDDCHVDLVAMCSLLGEADELISIFVAMAKKVKSKDQ